MSAMLQAILFMGGLGSAAALFPAYAMGATAIALGADPNKTDGFVLTAAVIGGVAGAGLMAHSVYKIGTVVSLADNPFTGDENELRIDQAFTQQRRTDVQRLCTNQFGSACDKDVYVFGKPGEWNAKWYARHNGQFYRIYFHQIDLI